MNRRTVIVSVLIGIAAFTSMAAITPIDLARLQAAAAPYHNIERARSAGYDLVPGLDFCFENPGVGSMGFHYLDTADLGNTTLTLLHPEALVYVPGPRGIQPGAVEYILPQDLWDGAGNTQPPELNGVSLHLNTDLGVYILHVRVWKNNPAAAPCP